jgi:uncharacterized membrane protein YecN with MAPEG domain
MIITLMTAGLCGIIFFALSWRVITVRRSAQVALGDGGDDMLLGRIRAHANFAEYVPICLVLMGLIEFEMPFSLVLGGVGVALVVCRILHAVGMARGGGNGWRVAGVVGTFAVLLGLSGWAIGLSVLGHLQ